MNNSLPAIIRQLNQARCVAITAHERPDGDALGASLALARILNGNGLAAQVLGLTPVPPRFAFLAEPGELLAPSSGWARRYDAAVVLDSGDLSRAGDFLQEAKGRIPLINIDHHPTNTEFGDLNWVEPGASSTGEMVCLLARQAGWRISAAAAEAAWAAIVTDTGRFAYENTTACTLRLAADLVEAGVVPERLDLALFQSVSPRELALTERAMRSLRYLAGGKLALVKLSRDDFAELGGGPELTQDVVDIPRRIQGVEAALFLYEPPGEAYTKISVRTKPMHDATRLCRRFAGGGHVRAAGCQLQTSLAKAETEIIAAALEIWFPDLVEKPGVATA